MTRTRWFERRWVLPMLLALWVIVPEVRRLIDWQIGFAALSVVNLIPLAALVLFIALPLRKQPRPLPPALVVTLAAWTIGFGLAMLVGLLTGQRLNAFYEFGQFMLPVLILYVIIAARDDIPVFRDLSWSLCALGAFVAVYGIAQYISPLPWDVLWVNNSGLSSIGVPEPFGLRIFSTLNSYELCADFLALAIITQLPYLRAGRGLLLRLPASLLMLAALALTFDRSAWIALVLGAFAYVVLSPRRTAALAGVGAIAVLGGALFVAGPSLFGQSPAFTTIADRLSSLGDVDSDTSYQARQYETAVTLEETREEPIGQGIGTVGTSTKLSEAQSTTTVDGGYLSRLLEMGVFGFAAYLIALGAALLLSLQAWNAARLDGRTGDALVGAACLALQLALLALDIAADHHNSLPGLLFWIAVAIPARQLLQHPLRVRKPHARTRFAPS